MSYLQSYISIHREFSKEHGSALLENKQLNALMLQLEVTAFEWKADVGQSQLSNPIFMSFITVG